MEDYLQDHFPRFPVMPGVPDLEEEMRLFRDYGTLRRRNTAFPQNQAATSDQPGYSMTGTIPEFCCRIDALELFDQPGGERRFVLAGPFNPVFPPG